MKVVTTRIRSHAVTLMMAITLAAGGLSAQAQIIYQDDFSGDGGALNGAFPDIGGTAWAAGSDWYDNGLAATTVAGSANGQAAFLPFSPVDNRVYTAEAIVLNNQPNWIGFGFLPALPAGGDWTATVFSVRHSNAPGYGWMLTRNSTGNDQEGFLGGGTAGGQPWNGDNADPTLPVNIQIILDTSAANWSVSWYINGALKSSAAYGGIGNPGIGGIGFSHDRNSAANNGGLLSRFELSEVIVPEPSMAALMGLGLLGVIHRLRRKL